MLRVCASLLKLSGAVCMSVCVCEREREREWCVWSCFSERVLGVKSEWRYVNVCIVRDSV